MGFVFVHMVGNLKMFLGRPSSTTYSEALRGLLHPLMPNTLGAVGRPHRPDRGDRHPHPRRLFAHPDEPPVAARPKYQSPRDYIAANFASRTMRWTGVIVGFYIIFHLMDLTWGWANPDFVRGAPYDNLVNSLSRWPVALVYIVSNLLLGVHLFHGSWSLFQSLGLNSPRYNSARRVFAAGFAAVITIPNVLFPIMVLAGVVH